MRKLFSLAVCFLFLNTHFVFGQSKECHANCNITWEQIRNVRNPLWTRVDITTECAEKIKARRKEFEDDDRRNFPYLRNVACSYAEGWVENVEGECQAGGPPPCCPVQHWHKDPYALPTWNEQMRIVYDKRYKELDELYNSCMNEVRRKQLEQQKEKEKKTQIEQNKKENSIDEKNKSKQIIKNTDPITNNTKPNFLPENKGEKESDIEYAKTRIKEINEEKKQRANEMDSVLREFWKAQEYTSKHLDKTYASNFKMDVEEVEKIANEHHLIKAEYDRVYKLCKSQIIANEPVDLDYLWSLSFSMNDNEGTVISNTQTIKGLVDINTKAIDGALNIIAAAPKRATKDEFDPLSDANQGAFWLGVGASHPIVSDDNGFKFTGLNAKLNMLIWGNHFQTNFEFVYTHSLNEDKNNRIAEKLLSFPANTITSFKPDGELGVSVGWGPYLIKRNSAYLVLQPTIGLKTDLGYTAKTSSTFSGPGFINDSYSFSLEKGETPDGSKMYTYFQYGAFLRFYTPNLLFSLGYMTHSPYDLYLRNTYFNSPKFKMDMTQISFSIAYRLL